MVATLDLTRPLLTKTKRQAEGRNCTSGYVTCQESAWILKLVARVDCEFEAHTAGRNRLKKGPKKKSGSKECCTHELHVYSLGMCR